MESSTKGVQKVLFQTELWLKMILSNYLDHELFNYMYNFKHWTEVMNNKKMERNNMMRLL